MNSSSPETQAANNVVPVAGPPTKELMEMFAEEISSLRYNPSCRVCRNSVNKGWYGMGKDAKGNPYLLTCCGQPGETEYTRIMKKIEELNRYERLNNAITRAKIDTAIRVLHGFDRFLTTLTNLTLFRWVKFLVTGRVNVPNDEPNLAPTLPLVGMDIDRVSQQSSVADIRLPSVERKAEAESV